MEKKWYKSKTLWTNIVVGVGALGATLTGIQIPGVDINGPNGIAIMAVLNALLRLASKSKIVV